MMKYIVTAFIACCFAITPAVAAEPPLGTWEWLSTEESAGVFTTPVDAGHTVQFEFNNEGTFVEYRDQAVYAGGDFWVDDVPFGELVITRLSLDYGDVSPAACAYGVDSDGILHMYWGFNPQNGLPSFPIERYLARDPVPVASDSWGAVKLLFR